MERLRLLFTTILFTIFFAGVSYSQITLTLPTVSGNPGTAITNAPVLVSDLTGKGVSSFQFEIHYNPAFITIQNMSTAGTLIDGAGLTSKLVDSTNGVFRVVFAGSDNISGSGTLLYLKIRFKSGGTSALTYAATGVYGDGRPFTSVFGSGSNTVTPVNGNGTTSGGGTTSYTISTSSNPAAGGTTSGGGTVNSGSSVTLTATANSGYTFSNWTENGSVVSTSSSYTFTVSAARTLVANFTQNSSSYNISTSSNPVAGGSTSGGGTVSSGSSVTVTAVANSGYTFSNWTENGTIVSSISSYTFTASVNRTLVANFTQSGGAQITLTLPTVTSPVGTTLTTVPVTVSDLTGKSISSYQFQINYDQSKVVIYGVNTSGTMSDGALTSAYVDSVGGIFRAICAGSGNINGSGTLIYLRIRFKAVGNSSLTYAATGTYGDGTVFTSKFGDGTFGINGVNGSATTGTPVSYTITTSSNPAAGGTTSGGATVYGGSSVTVIATANSGYAFTNWTENGTVVSSNASYTFSANASRALVANFVQTFSILTSSNPAAGGSTSGGGTKNSGTSVILTATANGGYYFSNWTENGTVVSSDASYAFTASANRTLVANFGQIVSCTISTSSNPAAGGTTSGGTTLNSGSNITVSAVPNTGYTFTNWTENGTVVSTSASYTFLVTASKALVANFALINAIPVLNLNPAGPFSIGEGTPLTINAVATDADAGDVLVLSYSSTPAITGANFNASTGVFTWTPVSGQAGTYNITFSVTDGKATTTKSTTITVAKVNIAPTLTLSPNGPYSVVEGATISITLSGTDPNVGDVLSYLYSSTPLMTGALLSPTTNVFSWTPPVGAAGNYNVTFFVSDGTAITQLSRTITVTPANRVPTLALNPVGPFTVAEGTTLNISAVGADADAADVLAYSFTATPTMTGATINSSTGAFSWKPVTNQAGTYNVIFSVTDGKATSTQSTTITVTKVNIAPTITLSPSAPYALLEGSSMAITVTGNDANNGDVLTYSYSSSPVMTGATFNPATHILYWQAPTGSAGVYNVTFSVSDGTAITQQAITVTVSVLNNNPTLTLSPAGPYTVAEGSTLTFTAIGADNDASDVLAYSYTSTPTITGATLSSTTGAFSWKPITNQAGVYNVTFSVTDGKSTTTKATTITVTKVNIAPTLTATPAGPYTLIEGATLAVALAGADANNGDVLTYSFTSTPAITGATLNASTGAFSWIPAEGKAGTYNVTFSVSDGALTTSINSTITVTPLNTAPTLSLNPAGPFSVDEGVTLTFSAVGADVNAGDVLAYSIVSAPEMTGSTFSTTTGAFSWKPAINQAGVYNVTLKVTDGKLTTQVQTTVTVRKVNLAPTLTLNPAGPYLVAEGQTLTITLVGTDPNTNDVLTYSITAPTTLPEGVKLTGNAFTWTPTYTQGTTTPYNFTFTLQDDGGLSAAVSIMIVVSNTNRAPSFTDVLPAGKVAIVNKPTPVQFTYTYKATDPDGDKLYFSLISSPTGSDITADGLFSWGPTESQAGKSYTVTVMVSDGTLSVQTTQIISADPKVVAVKKENGLPAEYELSQNYPNPFNPTTLIEYSLPKEGFVKLIVYDVLGKEIAVLVNKNLNAGYHSINFDASGLQSGIYFYRIQTNDFVSTKKMMLMK